MRTDSLWRARTWRGPPGSRRSPRCRSTHPENVFPPSSATWLTKVSNAPCGLLLASLRAMHGPQRQCDVRRCRETMVISAVGRWARISSRLAVTILSTSELVRQGCLEIRWPHRLP